MNTSISKGIRVNMNMLALLGGVEIENDFPNLRVMQMENQLILVNEETSLIEGILPPIYNPIPIMIAKDSKYIIFQQQEQFFDFMDVFEIGKYDQAIVTGVYYQFDPPVFSNCQTLDGSYGTEVLTKHLKKITWGYESLFRVKIIGQSEKPMLIMSSEQGTILYNPYSTEIIDVFIKDIKVDNSNQSMIMYTRIMTRENVCYDSLADKLMILR